ncbi:MAG: hypothetical protein HQL29_06365 [Candidatus Omnitrophica bacterium]|nr:hypothetical protein [Candidatus Omnitrophota bacterium]
MTNEIQNEDNKIWKEVGAGVGKIDKSLKKSLKKFEKDISACAKEKNNNFIYEIIYETGIVSKKIKKQFAKIEKEFLG